jgi:hypothetical protein
VRVRAIGAVAQVDEGEGEDKGYEEQGREYNLFRIMLTFPRIPLCRILGVVATYSRDQRVPRFLCRVLRRRVRARG